MPEYGEERLKNELIKKATPSGEMPSKKSREFAESQISKGMEGKVAGFGRNLIRIFNVQSKERNMQLKRKLMMQMLPRRKKNVRQIEDNKKLAEHQKDTWDKEAEKAFMSQEEDNRKLREQKVQDQITTLERQKRDQAEQYQENKLSKVQYYSDTRQMMQSVNTDLTNAIPQQQLQTQKAMQAGIDEMKDVLKAIQREGIVARAGGI